MATSALIVNKTKSGEMQFCFVHSDGGDNTLKSLNDYFAKSEKKLKELFSTSHVTLLDGKNIVHGREKLPQQATKARPKALIIIDSYDFVSYYYLIKDGIVQQFDYAGDLKSAIK